MGNEAYFGNGQIDEVSSARTSIIEKESEIHQRNEREKGKKVKNIIAIQEG